MNCKILATHELPNGTAVVLANAFGKITTGDKIEMNGYQYTVANISFVSISVVEQNTPQGIFIQDTNDFRF